MEIFKETSTFDFIGNRFKAFAISGVLMAASLAVLATKGLNYGIDFTGGSVVQLTFETALDVSAMRSLLKSAGYAEAIPQSFTGTNSYAIRIKAEQEDSADTAETFISALKETAGAPAFTVDQKEFVGPTVGKHLYRQALFAIVFSVLGIVAFVAFRFSNPLWGLAGIVALAHDVIAVLGLFSLLQVEVDLVLIAAVLTIAGYSINDTIVIFDRLREKMRVMRREGFGEVANASINGTLSRTMITSGTTFLATIVLFALGGSVIHDFATALCFGVVVGTYSSVGIAVPFVFQYERGRRPEDGEASSSHSHAHAAEARRGGKRRRR